MSTPKTLMSARKRLALNLSRLLVLGSAVSALVLANPGAASAAFPGENGKIAFTSNRDGNEEIYVMNADGTDQTRLTNNAGEDDQAVFSSDGTKIAFYSFRGGNGDIYVMNADGSAQTRVTTNGGPDSAPTFSPDGSKIAFVSVRTGDLEIYIMNADGTDQTRLTNNAGQDIEPAFSPDGTKIAFYSSRGGKQDTYVMNADGTGQTNLTNSPAGDPGPSFSPDGSKIAFGSNRGTAGDFEVVVMDPDGSNQTNLTKTTAHELEPAFSPDGTKIAYRRGGEAGDSEIYVMNADGTGQTRLTDNAATDNAPDWGAAEADAHPNAVDDATTVDENSGASAIDVLANDTDSDGGPKTIVAATDPDHGTVVLTGPVGARNGLTYEPDAGYCNDPDPAPADPFDYSLNGGSTATVSVTVTCADITPPNTTITGGPDGLTNQDTPTFTFTSSEAGSTFECRRDVSEPFEACTSPWRFPARVDNGPHTFEVRATDAAGNVDPTPATRDYDVDTTPSQAYFTDGPSGPTKDAAPTFTFQSIQSGATFECRVDDAHFTACDSPFTTPELPDGEHTASVRAIDSVGNVQPVPDTRTFTVDTVAADTSITGGPSGATSDNTPTFTFTSPEPGVTFECSLNDARFNPCTSPYDTGLLGGSDFTFQVRARDAAGNVDPTPATRSFTVDRNPPVTSITSAPGIVTNDNTPTIEFTSSKPDSTFECRVDDGAFAACTSPHTTALLADGQHTVAVRATDSIGNVDPDPADRTFRVDTLPPDTTINSGPSGLINDNTPEFGWDSTSDAAKYECRVDNAPFAACESPKTTAVLSDGQHTFELRAIDDAGNVDPTPAKRTFTVDTTARVTGITGGPSGLINDPTPTFSFATSDSDSTFECRVSPGSFGPCTSPYTSPAEPDGEHTFQVRSIDPAGNIESPPVGRTFTVDTNPPDTTITSGPTGTIDDQTPTFGFSSPESGAALECRVDGAAFAPCASPYTTALLANGSHTFEARATDAAGNTDPSPATRTFTVNVDTTAPTTHIDSGPANLTNQVKPKFTFSADEAATFECKLDAGAFAPCESGDEFGPLGEGSHTFAVRATDLAGNVDPTPATRDWIVDTTPPQTTITSGPSGLSLSSLATFAFTSSEGGSTFQCQLDGGAWQACASPKTYTGVYLGSHSFAVRAIDPAGNTDPTPAEGTWLTLGLLPF